MAAVIDDCVLCDEGHPVHSFARGPKEVEIVVVTNRKNSAEFQRGLEMELTTLGLDVGEVYFTPVYKCGSWDVNLSNKKVKDHAAKYLIPELEDIKPKFILALGNEALIALTGKSGITKYRGKFFSFGQAEVMSTISPSSVKRNPGQKPGFLADLRLFVNKTRGREMGIPDPKYLTVDSKEALRKMGKILDMTEEIYLDIETLRHEYYTEEARMVSLAATCVIVDPSSGVKKRAVFALPLYHPQSPWRGNWKRVLQYVSEHSVNIKKVVAHNSSFDCKWLIWCGVKLYPTFDTMLAIALLDENVQKGLKPQAMARLGVEAWGIDTGNLLEYPIGEVLHYNVLDTWYMYWIKQQLVEELKEQPRIARIFHFVTMPAQRDLIDSEIRGAWIDRKRLMERHPQAVQKLANIEESVARAAGLAPDEETAKDWQARHVPGSHASEFIWPGHPDWPENAKNKPMVQNFNASIFARWMLFQYCELPVLERGKPKEDGSPGDPSMAEGILKALKGKHPVIEPMLERVTAQKQLSSFFNPYLELIDDDDRIHTTFKLAGTVTGRLSSGKADADKISGTRGKLRGVNLQQVPRDPFIRGLFGAPPRVDFR